MIVLKGAITHSIMDKNDNKQPNIITDQQILDIIFNISGVNMAIEEIEKHISDLSRHRRSPIYTQLLIIRVLLKRAVLNSIIYRKI